MTLNITVLQACARCADKGIYKPLLFLTRTQKMFCSNCNGKWDTIDEMVTEAEKEGEKK